MRDKYELLKAETRVNQLEGKLLRLFKDWEGYKKESKENPVLENPLYQKQEELNVTCLTLIKAYRDYVEQLKSP